MSKTHNELMACLKELHLPTARACYAEVADLARREELTHEAYLLEVMQRECQRRRQGRIERLLRDSQLPIQKSLGAFDLKRLPGKVSAVVRTLVEGSLHYNVQQQLYEACADFRPLLRRLGLNLKAADVFLNERTRRFDFLLRTAASE